MMVKADGGFDPVRLLRRLNRGLPEDVRVRALDKAPVGFDARWSASWRRYSYRIADGVADPLTRRHVLSHSAALDVEAMDEAAALMLGEHDFTAFCRQRAGASSVRTLQEMRWYRDAEGLVRLDIRADAFCHSMVRTLVGSMLPVGDGRWPVTRPAELLAARTRTGILVLAPARGLTLEEVGYPADPDLARQAGLSRRFRGLAGEADGTFSGSSPGGNSSQGDPVEEGASAVGDFGESAGF